MYKINILSHQHYIFLGGVLRVLPSDVVGGGGVEGWVEMRSIKLVDENERSKDCVGIEAPSGLNTCYKIALCSAASCCADIVMFLPSGCDKVMAGCDKIMAGAGGSVTG